jgi:hypothetical protein
VYEKADIERIPLDTAAYKTVEDIQDYSQLGGLKKDQDILQQQIYMFNAFMANRQQAIMSNVLNDNEQLRVSSTDRVRPLSVHTNLLF